MSRMRELTKRIGKGVEKLLGVDGEDTPSPLEIAAAIVSAVEERIEPVGGGQRVFPYNHLTVRVVAPSVTERVRLDATLSNIEARVRARLQEQSADVPRDLAVQVDYLAKPAKGWTRGAVWAIEYTRVETGARRHPKANVPTVRLVVLRGKAERGRYTFTEPIIRIGRTREPMDRAGRVRVNDVSFLDDGDATNQTVARSQASIRFDSRRRELRVYDEGGANGTRVVRARETIEVPRRDPRGVRVESGDVIELGRARVKVEVLS
ncbi:MAG: FHA domain-containing protein [Vicinamibacterales bacterium]